MSYSTRARGLGGAAGGGGARPGGLGASPRGDRIVPVVVEEAEAVAVAVALFIPRKVPTV